jgi:protein-tyrosine-phosphatase
MARPRVLFVCTGNTARSQMAERGIDSSGRSKRLVELPEAEWRR